jgi:DNA-binding GntR family transcriptional regulator
VNGDTPAFPAFEAAPRLHERVQEALREMIVSGQLGPGALLTPASLAEAMNTSATPVREALRVLQQEGLVEVSDRRFTRVATPRRSVADEAYPLIALLEANHIRNRVTVPEHLLDQAEAANNEQAAATTVSERMHAVIRFHRLLCMDAGPITSGFLATLYAKVALLEISYHTALWQEQVSTDEHREILGALRAGRSDEAANMMELHWQRGHQEVVALLERDEQSKGLNGSPAAGAAPTRGSRRRSRA